MTGGDKVNWVYTRCILSVYNVYMAVYTFFMAVCKVYMGVYNVYIRCIRVYIRMGVFKVYISRIWVV